MAQLSAYPSRKAYTPFSVTVTACTPSISYSATSGSPKEFPNRSFDWGADNLVETVDKGGCPGGFVPGSDISSSTNYGFCDHVCGFDITLTPMLKVTGSSTLMALPHEVKYYEEPASSGNFKFSFGKCTAAT
jgi:hypothetical protein